MKITIRKNFLYGFAGIILLVLVIIIILLTFAMNKIDESFEIDPGTHMGVVTLNVKNLANQERFYTEIVQLEKINAFENEVILGRSGVPVIKLIESSLNPPPMGSAGLYHVAILFETRESLAETLDNILQKDPEAYSGSGDHYVSEAFYFYDPEGNGIELYFDRPRSEWIWEDGKIKMGTMYIDEQAYIQKYKNLELSTQNSKLQTGHLHLKVGDIGLAREFYVNTLGFEITAELPTALFISAGGYHHHIGMNTWESMGAGFRKDSIGLVSFEIKVPKAFIDKLENQLGSKKVEFEKSNDNLMFLDPWGNRVIVVGV